MTTWKPITRPAAPYRMPEGDIETFRQMYEADEWKGGIKNARALLEEAYQQFKQTNKRAQGVTLPDTFKEVLEQEQGHREGNKTKGTFPTWLYFGVIGKANMILDDTETAEATLAYIDGEEVNEGMNPPNVLGDVYYQIKEMNKAELPTKVYVNTMNLDFFTMPEKILADWIRDSDDDKNREAIETFREELTRNKYNKIVAAIAKETGDDEAQLKDPAKRTPEQKARIITAIRKTIAAKNEAVWKSVLMQTYYYCRDVEKKTKLRRDTVENVLHFAVAYYYTLHPEKDYTAEADPKEARDGAEAAELYNKMLAFVEGRRQGTPILAAIYEFIDGNTKPEANKKEIRQHVETTATTLEKYSSLLQGNATNDFISTSGKQIRMDIHAGIGEAKTNATELTFTSPTSVKLSPTCKKVFDVLTLKLTKQLPQKHEEVDANTITAARRVSFTVQEYMNLCGIKNKTQAYQQLNDALNTIFNITMTFPLTVYEKMKYKGKDGKTHTKTEAKQKIIITRVLESLERDAKLPPKVENGKIDVIFAFNLTQYLANSYIMPYHNELLKIDSKHNPHSYFIGRRLCQHHNMNRGKENENRISVDTLISCCPDLPSYGEIMKDKRQVRKRIIDPVERDLNLLQDKGILADWKYRKPHGEAITDDEISNAPYKEWVNYIIEFELADYPEEKRNGETQSP